MDEKKYNGWTNYETWAVALWLDNERESYERWRYLAREFIQQAPRRHPKMFPEDVPHQTATSILANRIRAELLDNTPDVLAGVYADLLGAALSEVDWREIAGHYIDEVATDSAAATEGEQSS